MKKGKNVTSKGYLSYTLLEVGKRCELCYHSIKLITCLLGLSLNPLNLLIAFLFVTFLSL